MQLSYSAPTRADLRGSSTTRLSRYLVAGCPLGGEWRGAAGSGPFFFLETLMDDETGEESRPADAARPPHPTDAVAPPRTAHHPGPLPPRGTGGGLGLA